MVVPDSSTTTFYANATDGRDRHGVCLQILIGQIDETESGGEAGRHPGDDQGNGAGSAHGEGPVHRQVSSSSATDPAVVTSRRGIDL